MKVILQQDVKNLGKIGDLIKVTNGYARNYLFPRNLAVEATEKKVKEWTHLKRVSENKKRKAAELNKNIIEKLQESSVLLKVTAGDNDKLFGSVTNKDIAAELEKLGYVIDRRDIILEEPIKMLGEYQVTVKLGSGIEGKIKVVVEKAA